MGLLTKRHLCQTFRLGSRGNADLFTDREYNSGNADKLILDWKRALTIDFHWASTDRFWITMWTAALFSSIYGKRNNQKLWRRDDRCVIIEVHTGQPTTKVSWHVSLHSSCCWLNVLLSLWLDMLNAPHGQCGLK